MALRNAAVASALAFALVSHARPADATPRSRSCFEAYDAEQRLAERGDLLAAREELFTCGAASCPSGMQRDCVATLEALEPRIPTLSLAVVDDAGRDLVDVRVEVDGVPVRTRLDGRELPVNPGERVLRLSSPGRTASEVRLVAREREKGRVVRVVLAASASSPPTPPATPPPTAPPHRDEKRPVPLASLVLGGASVAGLAVFAGFGISGLSARSALDDCAPFCSEADRDAARTRLRVADVALGISVVTLGAALVVYLLHAEH